MAEWVVGDRVERVLGEGIIGCRGTVLGVHGPDLWLIDDEGGPPRTVDASFFRKVPPPLPEVTVKTLYRNVYGDGVIGAARDSRADVPDRCCAGRVGVAVYELVRVEDVRS